MSNKIQNSAKKRKYSKRRRAEREEATRLRIVEALVGLHGTVGAARTTIQELARRAGVQRATVYRHFPDEPSLFAACSEHWLRNHPPPNPAIWSAIEDPGRRLRTALDDLYRYFERNERMIDNNFRDEPRVEALRTSMDEFRTYFRAAEEILATGRKSPSGAPLRAALGHAVSFSTWKSLTREQGLAVDGAVDLISALVEVVEKEKGTGTL